MILVAVLLAGLARAFAFQTFFIPSSSMVPTLGVYDRILVQKAFFTGRNVREGDMVVFQPPAARPLPRTQERRSGQARHRAAGTDDRHSAGGSIYVDGRPLAEPYLPHYDPLGPPIPDASRQQPYRVPPGEFYVLGDNRAISCDSRYWGPIKGSSIVGKVVLVLWHDDHPDIRWF